MPRPPEIWNSDELMEDAKLARDTFVQSRLASLRAERDAYRQAHRAASQRVEALLDASDDLHSLTGSTIQDRNILDLARQLAVPPISLADLDTLTDSPFGQWVGQTTDRGTRPREEAFEQAAKLIRERLDIERAPWLGMGRAPSADERRLFIQWTAASPATGRVLTMRRSHASARQEAAVREAASAAGYRPTRPPGTLTDPIRDMPAGTYATASRKLNGANMDIPIRLHSTHPTGLPFLAIECKVSNSSLNSRKRLLEVTRKREVWDGAGMAYQFRTAAVISGVFSIDRLLEAQRSGVWLFWEHRLSDLTDFLWSP